MTVLVKPYCAAVDRPIDLGFETIGNATLVVHDREPVGLAERHQILERDLARLRETEITLQQILDNTTTVRVFAKDQIGRAHV